MDKLPIQVSEANIIHAYVEKAVPFMIGLFSKKGTSGRDLFLSEMEPYSLPRNVDSGFIFDFMATFLLSRYGRFFNVPNEGKIIQSSSTIGNLTYRLLEKKDDAGIEDPFFRKILFAIDRRRRCGYNLSDFFR